MKLRAYVIWVYSYNTCVCHTGQVLTQIRVSLGKRTLTDGFLGQQNGFGLHAVTGRDFDLGEYFPYDTRKYYNYSFE